MEAMIIGRCGELTGGGQQAAPVTRRPFAKRVVRRNNDGRAARTAKGAMSGLLGSTVLAVTVLSSGTRSIADGPGAPAECPFEEMPCDIVGDGRPGSEAPQVQCPCGPGAWIDDTPKTAIEPTIPFDEVEENPPFVIVRKAKATPNSAMARVSGSGTSGCALGCTSRSTSNTERAAFSYSQRVYWEGVTPACPRAVSLAAMGSATQAIGVTTTANLGCSASASSSLGGVCSSLGDASAQVANSLYAQAQFNSVSSTVKLSGNIGAMATVDSLSVQGSYSKLDGWETSGMGSATGTASFTVKPDRTYCAFTNKAFTRRAAGTVVVVGAGSVASGGAMAFVAAGDIKLWVD